MSTQGLKDLGGPSLPVFTATLFTSAFLLFWVQPLYSKLVLPLLGGSPAVWNTAMVFFQAALLAGYAYAHALAKYLPLKRQVVVHLTVLAVASLALPVALPAGWTPPRESNPVLWLIGYLVVGVGMPFFVVSATAPLLQGWFSQGDHHHAEDPYFLYGASNLGSVLALLGFPLILEPEWTLGQQGWGWALGYGALASMIALCGRWAWRQPPPTDDEDDSATPAPAWPRRLHWLALAFVPSSLLLGVTTHITTDLAAIPLLWVAPLLLYLLTFVIVFARRPLLPHGWMVALQPLLLAPLALYFSATAPIEALFPLHLAAFFVTAMVCHGELAARRPAADHLTEFYLWLSAGGVLGGMFNALIAPIVFNGVYEYPLIVAVACLLRPPALNLGASRWWMDLLAPAVLAGGLFAGKSWHQFDVDALDVTEQSIAFVAVGLYVLITSIRRVRFALTLGVTLVLIGIVSHSEQTHVLARMRSFFGVYTVRATASGDERWHVLAHGTTTHGAQSLVPEKTLEPITYYHREGPFGQMFKTREDAALAIRNVGVVGLGTGTTLAYRKPDQRWTIFEIDPLMERLARDRRYFTFAAELGGATPVVIGDARLSLTEEPDNRFDILVLDAFSSDAIPVHLLTREALALYLRKLAPGGWLAMHVSNRHLRLGPVVAELVADAGAAALEWYYEKSDQDGWYIYGADWIVVARRPEDLAVLAEDKRWDLPARAFGARPWTDDYSNIVRTFKRG